MVKDYEKTRWLGDLAALTFFRSDHIVGEIGGMKRPLTLASHPRLLSFSGRSDGKPIHS